MEHKPTRRLIAIMTLVLFVLNILAVIIFSDSISITAHDLCPAIFFVIHVIIIILAFHYEHEPNKLLVFLNAPPLMAPPGLRRSPSSVTIRSD